MGSVSMCVKPLSARVAVSVGSAFWRERGGGRGAAPWPSKSEKPSPNSRKFAKSSSLEVDISEPSGNVSVQAIDESEFIARVVMELEQVGCAGGQLRVAQEQKSSDAAGPAINVESSR